MPFTTEEILREFSDITEEQEEDISIGLDQAYIAHLEKMRAYYKWYKKYDPVGIQRYQEKMWRQKAERLLNKHWGPKALYKAALAANGVRHSQRVRRPSTARIKPLRAKKRRANPKHFMSESERALAAIGFLGGLGFEKTAKILGRAPSSVARWYRIWRKAQKAAEILTA